MKRLSKFKTILAGSICSAAVAAAAHADSFSIPSGDLKTALDNYSQQVGVAVLYPASAVKGVRTHGVNGSLPADEALSRILSGTGFSMHRDASGVIAIVPNQHSDRGTEITAIQLAQATPPPRAAVETVTVTSSKLGGADVQSIPIAITALSQEQLTSRQIAGGPDLIKEVPNLTFTKTNFTGYSINIRGIGTQAISVTTDPAVAVSFNDTPFLRNHFFEQEFYDVAQVEVLRGPQGTLYGRNATAGVVNVTSAVPTDHFEAMGSVDIGNFKNRRLEAMINLPIAGDELMLRVAGEWTKRDGYSFNSLTDSPIDGRDLWSTRATLRWQPVENFHTDFIWEHFREDDDRLRSSKQLCTPASYPETVLGVPVKYGLGESVLNQGCGHGSLYGPEAYSVPDGLALPYYGGLTGAQGTGAIINPLSPGGTFNPYASTAQSHDLRVIESTLDPEYKSDNDTLELNTEWRVAPRLTLNSTTAYNRDFLWSTEDYNRFNTQPGIFGYDPSSGWGLLTTLDSNNYRCSDGHVAIGTTCDAAGYPGYFNQPKGLPTGIFCDPQLGCSNRLVAEDLAEEHSWQFSQELRLSSDFEGPLNFSAGGNYMHYVTDENYYVFINTLTMYAAVQGITGRVGVPYVQGDHNQRCLSNGHELANPQQATNPEECLGYIDPNPIGQLDNQGHNYFLSQNPYSLNSYAMFGEAYYQLTNDLKLTAGLRWTDDQKHFVEIPSEVLTKGYGYPSTGNIDQEWKEFTGRAVVNWTPHLNFTDQTMVYGSYAHGYKAGGANPPGAVLLVFSEGDVGNPTHPKTFDPEFNDAFEVGTKNTMFDSALTLNGDVFYYDYKGYQISQIVDRTSVNLNFDATSWGAELTATWEPIPGLKFGFNGGYEKTRLADGSKAIDLLDRTAGHPGWLINKPFPTQASNCVIPDYVIANEFSIGSLASFALSSNCGAAYGAHEDPLTQLPYTPNPTTTAIAGNTVPPGTYPGFDPLAGNDPDHPYTGQNTYNGVDYGPAPNNGTGFFQDLSGKELPNAPNYTVSLTADYTTPVSPSWAATFHTDFYWQSQSWARVFNSVSDQIRGYTNVNLALILTDDSGWQVMGYLKNVFDTTAITGTFLNSDDTALTTNVFLTDPRLFGVRVTKRFDGGNSGGLGFADSGGGRPTLWVTAGGNFNNLLSVDSEVYYPDYIRPGGAPLFGGNLSGPAPAGTQSVTELMAVSGFPSPASYEKAPTSGFDWEGKLALQPQGTDWVFKAGVRYGRSSNNKRAYQTEIPGTRTKQPGFSPGKYILCKDASNYENCHSGIHRKFVNAKSHQSEQHTIMDFEAGVNIGIGLFGKDGEGNVSGGIRMAQFTSQSNFEINTDPDYFFKTNGTYHNVYETTGDEKRSFHGMGPEVGWDANQTILGNADDGAVTLDWGINAAVLFGRQSVNAQHFSSYCHVNFASGTVAGCVTGLLSNTQTKPSHRSRRKVVPNLGGYIGASARYNNAKVSFGYRADTFFGAMDGGQATAKDYNRGFYGPYMNVSIGLGG